MTPKTILFVDDNRDDHELVKRALRQLNLSCRLVALEDGNDFADYLFALGRHSARDSRDLPELILLDLKMPGLDGCQVLQVLKRTRRRPNLPPVVVFSSSDHEEDIREAYRVGANSYIRKPIDFSEYAERIGEIVHYWLEVNTAVPNQLLSAPLQTEELIRPEGPGPQGASP